MHVAVWVRTVLPHLDAKDAGLSKVTIAGLTLRLV